MRNGHEKTIREQNARVSTERGAPSDPVFGSPEAHESDDPPTYDVDNAKLELLSSDDAPGIVAKLSFRSHLHYHSGF